MKIAIEALIIEDSEPDAALLIRELERGGFVVRNRCVDSAAALRQALSAHDWDVVFCDYTMPHFRGTDAMAMVRERDPDVPFIFVSGTMGEDVAVEAMRAGAHDYIVKGNLKRLIPAVERELREAASRRERKEIAQALKQREEQFRLITENVADLIAVLDLEGTCTYASPSYQKLIDDPGAMLEGDFFRDIHAEDRERVREIIRETASTGAGRRIEYRFIARGGQVRSMESQGSVIRDHEGRITNVVVVSRDITEKKSLEQQLLRSQRLEGIGTLAGGIAHDLNNVLAPIVLATDVLRGKLPDAESRRILETLEKSARRGAEMVKQVLAFARGADGQRLLIQPRQALDEVMKIVKGTFPKSITLRVKAPAKLRPFVADPTQIQQVLLNICVNARDAMPSGGILSLTAEDIELDETYARINTAARPGPYVKISIADTGSGIAPEILDKIFEPFFTTKEVNRGTGLGLSTVQAIVRSHGGFLDVRSEPNHGSVFTVYLPSSSSRVLAPAEPHPLELPVGHGETILVVDDEAAIREITKSTLETYGYKVFTASDGAEAVSVFAEMPGSISLVLTDMMMPYMEGQSTIRALRSIDPAVRIIAVSGFSLPENPAAEGDSGVQAYLPKPYTAAKLLSAVHDVLQAPPA